MRNSPAAVDAEPDTAEMRPRGLVWTARTNVPGSSTPVPDTTNPPPRTAGSDLSIAKRAAASAKKFNVMGDGSSPALAVMLALCIRSCRIPKSMAVRRDLTAADAAEPAPVGIPGPLISAESSPPSGTNSPSAGAGCWAAAAAERTAAERTAARAVRPAVPRVGGPGWSASVLRAFFSGLHMPERLRSALPDRAGRGSSGRGRLHGEPS